MSTRRSASTNASLRSPLSTAIGECVEHPAVAVSQSLARHADATPGVARQPTTTELVEWGLVGERHDFVGDVREAGEAEVARPVAADQVRAEALDE